MTLPTAMSLTFSSPVPPLVVVLAAAAGACAIVVGVRRIRTLNVGPRARTLLALRIAAVAALVLAMLDPTMVLGVEPARKPRVLLCLDGSASMATPDGLAGRPRLEEAKRAGREVLERLADRFRVEPYVFTGTAAPLASVDALRSDGTLTDLAAALAVARAADAEAPVALVLVSDGIDTSGAATQAAGGGAPTSSSPAAPCPVFAVPVGTDLSGIDDVRVAALRAPDRVDLHTEAAIEVDVAATGSAKFLSGLGAVPVSLSLDGKPVGTEPVALSATGRGTARFSVRLDEAGVHAVEARVPPIAGDRARSDDARRAYVSAEDPALRVLLLASRVTQEYRPLRAELARAPGVRLACVLRVAPGKQVLDGFQALSPGSDEGFGAGFPSDAKALARFDVVVLGPTPAADVTTTEAEALAKFAEEGGGLLVLGGEHALGLGGWAGSPLARVLPVEVRGAGESLSTGAFRAEATAEGRALSLAPAPAAGGASSAALVVQSLHRTGPSKPGASSLLEVRTPDAGARPLLVGGPAGKGRTLVLLTNTLHRAALAGGEGREAYASLVRQSVRHLASRDEERDRFSLEADRPRYAPKDVAHVRAAVRGADHLPLPDATVDGKVLSMDGKSDGGKDLGAVTFRPDPARGAGAFVADVPVTGEDPVRVRATASTPKGPVATREVLLRTGGDEREGEVLAQDLARLTAIASASGGAVVRPSEIGDLPARLAATAPEAPTPIERSLAFDGPWMILLIAALLAAEWLLRRRMNLP